MEMSNLLEDLLEEIFCKLPVTSLRPVRLTCKKWNTISKTQSFAEKHINKTSATTRELSMIMVIENKVCLMEFNNINGIPSITRKAELVGLEKIDINRVYNCDGLLLCSTKQAWTRGHGLVVWNPYWTQTKWISTPKHSYGIDDYYAIGYEVINNNTRSYKILKFSEWFVADNNENYSYEYEIYDFKDNSWRDIVIPRHEWMIDLCPNTSGVSLKGNIYWFGKEDNGNNFLICFDFTSERFGPRMSFPFADEDNVVLLCSVKGEKLAVLVERLNTFEMEIWITSGEINPTMMSSWSKLLLLLTVEKRPFTSWNIGESFFIDEENKFVIFVGKVLFKPRNKAYIYGGGGYLIREVDLGESKSYVPLPTVCSYAPSSLHIK